MPLDDLLKLAREKNPVVCDSRKVVPGAIFVAVPGASQNGALFIRDALDAGAKTVVCAPGAFDGEPPTGARVVYADDPRDALWRLAGARWDAGEKAPAVVGVTGTNGKTTSAYLLEKIFSGAGLATGVIGTVEYRWQNYRQAAPLTTPGPLETCEALWNMAEAGVKMAIMEVSSHSLAQKRVDAVRFSGAIFTNLTQDHLDFHKDMESYFRAKTRLFLELGDENKPLAINADDPYGRRLLELKPEAIAYGLTGSLGDRYLSGRILEHGPAGMELEMEFEGRRWRLSTPMVGEYNASNLLGAQALALGLGLNPDAFSVLSDFSGAPGRLERVPNDDGLNVFVDYAHTPDAIAKAAQALRGAGYSRIIVVFGCGGNRDRVKRPLMAEAAANNADVVILTSDNPRDEDPEQIIADAAPGLKNARLSYVEADRRRATALALEFAAPEDAVLIAGKGHEDYQIIKGVKYHYSDAETVREILNCAFR